MALEIRALGGPLGAEVIGADRSRIGADAEAVFQALIEHHLLIFRGPVMSDDALVELAGIFGPVMKTRTRYEYATRPEIMIVSNITEDGKTIGAFADGEVEWHYDGLHQQKPYELMMLHAVEIPKIGGETRFANMCLAYDRLPTRIKSRIADLTAASSYNAAGYNGAASASNKSLTPDAPVAVHPVVRELPETGAKAIYVCQLMTDRIVELDDAESSALLFELYQQALRPDVVYEHDWRVGDLVLWDNRCLMHARNDFGPEERRLLKRVTIASVGMTIPDKVGM